MSWQLWSKLNYLSGTRKQEVLSTMLIPFFLLKTAAVSLFIKLKLHQKPLQKKELNMNQNTLSNHKGPKPSTFHFLELIHSFTLSGDQVNSHDKTYQNAPLPPIPVWKK